MEKAAGGPKVRGFGSVSSSAADSLLENEKISLVSGQVYDPIEVPPTLACESFDYSPYANEKEGTPALMRHHQQQLSRCGVHFGRGGYQMYDLQKTTTCFRFIAARAQVYNGNTDCCVAPFGLFDHSAPPHLRVGFEHKFPFEPVAVGAGAASSSSSTVRCFFDAYLTRNSCRPHA